MNNQAMQKASLDLAPFAVKKIFIKIVEEATGGWAHIKTHNIQSDSSILTEYTARKIENE